MAKRIIVLSTFGDKPTGERIKKSRAQLEVRRLLADWVIPNESIRRRTIRACQPVILAPSLAVIHIPIPELLPPLEWYDGFGYWPKVHSGTVNC